MNALQAPIVRIVLRYGVGAIVALAVTHGFLSPETGAGIVADAQIEALVTAIVAGVIGAVTELAYGRAKREGGDT